MDIISEPRGERHALRRCRRADIHPRVENKICIQWELFPKLSTIVIPAKTVEPKALIPIAWIAARTHWQPSPIECQAKAVYYLATLNCSYKHCRRWEKTALYEV